MRRACLAFLPLLILLALAVERSTAFGGEPEAVFSVQANGNLRFQPRPTRTVFVQGTDVLAAVDTLDKALEALEAELGLEALGLSPLPNPVSAVCFCPPGRINNIFDCAPAVQYASGVIACCASSATVSSCDWTKQGNSTSNATAFAACRSRIQVNAGTSKNRQLIQELRVGTSAHVLVSTQGLAFRQHALPACAGGQTTEESGSSGSGFSSTTIYIIIIAALAFVLILVILIVAYRRASARRDQNRKGPLRPAPGRHLFQQQQQRHQQAKALVQPSQQQQQQQQEPSSWFPQSHSPGHFNKPVTMATGYGDALQNVGGWPTAESSTSLPTLLLQPNPSFEPVLTEEEEEEPFEDLSGSKYVRKAASSKRVVDSDDDSDDDDDDDDDDDFHFSPSFQPPLLRTGAGGAVARPPANSGFAVGRFGSGSSSAQQPRANFSVNNSFATSRALKSTVAPRSDGGVNTEYITVQEEGEEF